MREWVSLLAQNFYDEGLDSFLVLEKLNGEHLQDAEDPEEFEEFEAVKLLAALPRV